MGSMDLDLAWVLQVGDTPEEKRPVLALLRSDDVDDATHAYVGFGTSIALTVVATTATDAHGAAYYRPTGHTINALLCANNSGRSRHAPVYRGVNHPSDAYVHLPGAVVGHAAHDLFDVYLPAELVSSSSGSVRFVDCPVGDPGGPPRRVMCVCPSSSSSSFSSSSPAGDELGFAVLCPSWDELRAVPALGRALSSTCYGEVRLCERLVRVPTAPGSDDNDDDNDDDDDQPVFTRRPGAARGDLCAVKVCNDRRVAQLRRARFNFAEDPVAEVRRERGPAVKLVTALLTF
jgi:hypothetical protein